MPMRVEASCAITNASMRGTEGRERNHHPGVRVLKMVAFKKKKDISCVANIFLLLYLSTHTDIDIYEGPHLIVCKSAKSKPIRPPVSEPCDQKQGHCLGREIHCVSLKSYITDRADTINSMKERAPVPPRTDPSIKTRDNCLTHIETVLSVKDLNIKGGRGEGRVCTIYRGFVMDSLGPSRWSGLCHHSI